MPHIHQELLKRKDDKKDSAKNEAKTTQLKAKNAGVKKIQAPKKKAVPVKKVVPAAAKPSPTKKVGVI